MTLSLDFLPQTAYVFLLIFARVGAMSMALPGVGDRSVPSRVRLVFALALTLTLYPLIQAKMGPMPSTLGAMAAAIVTEALIGIAIAISVRMIVAGLVFAGATIAFQLGLAYAQTFDPSQGGQSTIVANFLMLLSVTLIFATDLHHLMLAAMHDSYVLFVPGKGLPFDDLAHGAVRALTESFRIALQLSAPFLVFGLIFYLGVGVISRLIPQVQVFFVAMPANILFSLALFLLMLSTMMLWYADYFGTAIKTFLSVE